MPGKRYDYEKFTKEIEKFRDRLEKGEHITITEEESTDFFGKSIERANTGKCILEKGDNPKNIHATIPHKLGSEGYSLNLYTKDNKKVLEVWKPPSKDIKERKVDKKHLLGSSLFFLEHAEKIDDIINKNNYWYSDWNFSIGKNKKYLSAPFRLYVGHEGKVKAYFKVVDFWTDIVENKDLGEVLGDKEWREHFLDDQSTINSTHWDEIHKEKWKTRTIFKCDKIEIFPREKDLNEFESMGGYQPRFYQKGFDIIVGENKKGGNMKLIGIVAKIAWSHNGWRGFDKEGYKKRGQYNYRFVEETGYAHEWWTFYEKFSEKYYYGHVELKGKKPRKEFKNGLIPIISYNINDNKIYLVGFYGNAEFSGSGFNTERKMIELFPNDYINDLKLNIKEKGTKWDILENILNGKRNYEGDIRAPKELSTVFDEEAYIPIDSKKDLNIKKLGQVVYSYIGDNEKVPPANIYKLLLRAKEKHKEILENIQNTQKQEEIKETIKKIDLVLNKYFPEESVISNEGKVNMVIKNKKIDFTKKFEIKSLYFENEDKLKEQITTALLNKKHIILIGPPGTGKSKLAKEICEYYCGVGNYIMSTATSDWSTFETIGGYHPKGDELKFHPGIFLQCFKDKNENQINKWLIIDEINRADIDKAFGSLFSALTGDNITLPFEINEKNVEIIGKTENNDEIKSNRFIIHPDWRIIATMNTFDKSSLYEMSYAFMRRFAFIQVTVPNDIDENLIKEYIKMWKIKENPEIYKDLSELWKIVNKYREIGPAVIEDIYNYVSEKENDYVSAITMYVMPQFEGLLDTEQIEFIKELAKKEFIEDKDRLRDFASELFGIGKKKFENGKESS